MPLPVGHILIGAMVAKKTRNNFLEVLIFANLPDIDYFYGLFTTGNMNSFHRAPNLTHTPLFAVSVALLYWLFNKTVRGVDARAQSLGVGLLILSHLFVDFYMPFLYMYDRSAGNNGFWDFIFAHILSFEFLYNNLVDLIFYGAIYILVVKFVFREKKLF